jgi:hypothetical protein
MQHDSSNVSKTDISLGKGGLTASLVIPVSLLRLAPGKVDRCPMNVATTKSVVVQHK